MANGLTKVSMLAKRNKKTYSMNYTIQRGQDTLGTYTLDQIRTLSSQGTVFPNDLAWPEGAQAAFTVADLLQRTQSDGTSGIVPYKNPQALTAYYLAIASLIPCIGLLAGVPAVILGLKGLKRVKREPWVKGTAHAWIGIILGGLMSLIWLGGLLFFGIGIAMESSSGQ